MQGFGYRGASYVCLPGDVIVLHPDEVHDGYAAGDAGFGYRLLYVEPALIFAAARTLAGQSATLPFVRQPVLRSEVRDQSRTMSRQGVARRDERTAVLPDRGLEGALEISRNSQDFERQASSESRPGMYVSRTVSRTTLMGAVSGTCFSS